jgi:hypothetical protein
MQTMSVQVKKAVIVEIPVTQLSAEQLGSAPLAVHLRVAAYDNDSALMADKVLSVESCTGIED